MNGEDLAKQILPAFTKSTRGSSFDDPCVEVIGKSGKIYEIRRCSTTRIYDDLDRILGQACLEFYDYVSRLPPTAIDLVIAQYILIKSDEPYYLKTANIEWYRRH